MLGITGIYTELLQQEKEAWDNKNTVNNNRLKYYWHLKLFFQNQMQKVTLQNSHNICWVLQTFSAVHGATCVAKRHYGIPGLECYDLIKCKYSVQQSNKVFRSTNENQSPPLWATNEVLKYLPMAQDGINCDWYFNSVFHLFWIHSNINFRVSEASRTVPVWDQLKFCH